MSAHRVALMLTTGCALFAFSSAAVGQATAIPRQDLDFGQLQAGTTESVSPTDAARRAEFMVNVRGPLIAQFILPSAMTSVQGGSVPLSFGAGDGLLSALQGDFTFDPTVPFPVPFSRDRGRPPRIYLGGSAGPVVDAPAGTYTAVITLMIIQAGA